MFWGVDAKGSPGKELLTGDIQEGKTVQVVKKPWHTGYECVAGVAGEACSKGDHLVCVHVCCVHHHGFRQSRGAQLCRYTFGSLVWLNNQQWSGTLWMKTVPREMAVMLV
jgi:hypothetical protein